MIKKDSYIIHATHTMGLTIIELLVVIAIIGILTTISFSNLSGSRLRARDTERVTEIAQLVLALENFYNTCRTYPTALIAGDDGSGACPGSVTLGSFISPIPQDPRTNIVYDYGTDGDTYIVGATLEANHEALNDDIDIDTHGVSCSGAFEYCKGG